MKEGIKPKWWDANKHRVTYNLISTLLHSDVTLDVPIKSQELLIKNALTTQFNCVVIDRLVEATQKKVEPGPNKPKRKKVEIRFESVPVVTNPDELVGKRVEHLTFDYEENEKWYKGTAICIKPNTESELVIKYD